MRMHMRPASRAGWWSVALAGAFLVLVPVVSPIVVSLQGPRTDETFLDNPLLSGVMLTGLVAALGALVMGLTAAVRSRDRAVLVMVACLIGVLVLWFLVGEIVVSE